MIGRQEILDFAADFGLDPQVVEKDYMLGWLLAGVGQHAEIGSDWLFKGGTCLKKCYFERGGTHHRGWAGGSLVMEGGDLLIVSQLGNLCKTVASKPRCAKLRNQVAKCVTREPLR